MNVFEIGSIREALLFLNHRTHVFFDIDNTLMTTRHHFGSERWERFMHQNFMAQGLPDTEAYDRASDLWKAVQMVSEIQFVEEEETRSVLEEFRRKGVPLYGITSRSHEYVQVTEEQLAFLNFQFSPTPERHMADSPVVYSKGIFYCGNVRKGDVLHSFVQRHPCQRILMIDDLMTHLKSAAEALNIPFVGLRYTYLDQRKNDYIPCEITQLLSKIFINPHACHFLRKAISWHKK